MGWAYLHVWLLITPGRISNPVGFRSRFARDQTVLFSRCWLNSAMSDPRNVAHDKKVIHEKQKHGEDLAEGAAHVPQPGKKTAREESHGAHKETDAEKAGGSIDKPSESIAENSE
jgi:hypothetical protein